MSKFLIRKSEGSIETAGDGMLASVEAITDLSRSA